MVADDPESFADLDGHTQTGNDDHVPGAQGNCDPAVGPCTPGQGTTTPPPPSQKPADDPCPCISENAAAILSSAGKEADVGVNAAMVVTSPQYAVMAGVAVAGAAPTVTSTASQVITTVNTVSTQAYVATTSALATAGAAIGNTYRAGVELVQRGVVTVDTLRSGGGGINAAVNFVQGYRASTSQAPRQPPPMNSAGATGFFVGLAKRLLAP